MRIAVVDDSRLDRERLVSFLSAEKDCECTEFENGEDFVRAFPTAGFDVVFLDIYMNGMDGMDVALRIREADDSMLLVFCTASSEHAVASYKVHAFNYLLKPYDADELRRIVELCRSNLGVAPRHIEIKAGRDIVRIPAKSIVYADVQGHYARIHTMNEVIRTRMAFRELAPLLLEDERFLNCYRTVIVNMDAIVEISAKGFTLKNEENVSIGREYLSEAKRTFADYLFRKSADAWRCGDGR